MDFSGKRILFIGFRGKESHLKTARSKGMLLDLMIDASEMRDEYRESFNSVHVLDDIFDWRQITSATEGTSYDAVLTRFEDFTSLVSAVADHLNLPGVALQDAPKFRNKYLMRQAFEEFNVPSADFLLVSSFEEAKPMAEKHGYPLIVKQISGIHSKYVARVKDERELQSTIELFLDCLSKETGTLHGQLHHFPKEIGGPDHITSLLVEECLSGEELTVDAFVVDGEPFLTPICKYVMPEDMGFHDHHLPVRTMPYNLTTEEREVVNNAVKQSLKALGANYCVTHAEVFFDKEKKDCRLIEVASRGGGFRAEMVRHTCGGDYDFGLVRSALGIGPDVAVVPSKYAAVAEVFSPENGILEEVDYSCLEGHDNIYSITHNRCIGDMVGRAADGHSFVLKFLVTADSYEEVDAKAKDLLLTIRSSIHVRPA
jgi:biotin carboxylase